MHNLAGPRPPLPECPHTLCEGKGPVGNSNNAVTVPRQTAHCSTVVATASLPVMEPISAKNPSVHLHRHPSNLKPTETLLPTNPIRNRIFKVPTPVQPHTLDTYLEGYDPAKRLTLVEGFKSGFPLGISEPVPPAIFQNHPSVHNHESFVRNKIIKEIQLNRVKGPFKEQPLASFVCSPLGVVPKKAPNSFRIIHDLSFPKTSTSVNSAIPTSKSTVSLETFDDVAKLVLKAGKNALIAKADIEEAFKIIPISPLDYNKLGFSFNNLFYFGTVLPMGASSSVAIFESFAQAIQWILHNKLAVNSVSHIIDDFIFVGPAASPECQRSLDTFFTLASELGVPINREKTILPATVVEVHGISVNTSSLSAHLPEDKILLLKQILASSMNKKKITLSQLQSLLGHLNFACKAIKPGRCFLRRLYDLTIGKSNPKHFIKLTRECRADLKLWYSFLEQYNGCTLLTGDRFISSETLQLHSDAAGSVGFACTHGTSWTFGLFPEHTKRHHINILELYPITLAVFLFSQDWCNKNILFICDNLAVVHCLNKQTSKDPVMMQLIRIIVLRALKYNFCFRCKHIASSHNTVCDRLSRFQIKEALHAAPYLDTDPLPIPWELSPATLLK